MKKIDFSKYSSIKIGSVVDVEMIEEMDEAFERYSVIGGANNILVSNNPPKLAKLSKNFDYIMIKDGFLHIGGATPSGKILSFAKKNDISGFELMQKLPGTIGGMVKMNAGLKEHEIFNSLVAINSAKGYIEKKDIDYGYRHTDISNIIYEAVFDIKKGFSYPLLEYFEKLRANQPKEPSAGSCFKNPKGDFAGRVLDECGLKGYRIGDAGFSEKHANFLVNYGSATFDDAISLIELAKKRVFEKFGIDLELEVVVL